MVPRAKKRKLCIRESGAYSKAHVDIRKALADGTLVVTDTLMQEYMNMALHMVQQTDNADACQVHMQCLLGLASNLILRIECKQSPRNTHQTAMTTPSFGARLGHYKLMDDTQLLIHAEQSLLQSNPNACVCIMNGHNVLIALSSTMPVIGMLQSS